MMTQGETLEFREWPIEGVAALLAAIAKPCDCERGQPDREVCVDAPVRWERELV